MITIYNPDLQEYCLIKEILSVDCNILKRKKFKFSSKDYCKLQNLNRTIEKYNGLCNQLFIEYEDNGEENIDRIRALNFEIFNLSNSIFKTKCKYESC